MSATKRTLLLGTRGSKLARWQAEWVAGELRGRGHVVELVEIATRGDVERAAPIEDIGTRGVFTKEIQRALLAGDVDLAVHSLKDLPTEPVNGLVLAAVPERDSPADVLVCASALGARLRLDPSHPSSIFSSLPERARVGTGSLRRQAQLLHVRADLQLSDVRGNVDTRLRKLDEGQFDAIVLAEAGLRRLGLADRVTQVLPFAVMLPAVGQGALGIECRAADTERQAILRNLEHAGTRAAVTAERVLLEHLRGGCMAPIGALGKVGNGIVELTAAVLSADGKRRLFNKDSAPIEEAEQLGRRLADSLLAQGAGELIAGARGR
jgi:hydroxymethylbilane synthase